MTKPANHHRRRFLKTLGLATASSSVLATQGKLGLVRSALAAGKSYAGLDDYKSLVCVFLRGGNDAFNMIVPYESSEYRKYANIRQALAIAHGELYPVAGNSYGLHPSLPDVANLFEEGRLAVVANVGNLIQPTTRADVLNKSGWVPPNLFSHNHQEQLWQTNVASSGAITRPGWGGLFADRLLTANSGLDISFTMDGSNLWQGAQQTRSFNVDPRNGIGNFEHFSGNSWPPSERGRTAAWNTLIQMTYRHVLEGQAADSMILSKSLLSKLRNALNASPELHTWVDDTNSLALQLRMVARMISVRQILGMKRQIFFVRLGNWDTHGNQIALHATQLGLLNHALESFYRTTEELGVQDSVTTFSASEFGRTLTTNGDGTDHGWGTHNIVMGGGVYGGKIHGRMPELKLGGRDDADRAGRIIPKQSVDQYGATLARWMGLSETDINAIFPNVSNFNTKYLKFMG